VEGDRVLDTFNENSDVEYETKYTVILKGRFKGLDTNSFGLFVIFLNEELRMVENLIAVVSHFSSLYETDPAIPWDSLEETLINLKWKGDISVNITIDLQNYLESALDRDRGNELYQLVKNNDISRVESLLQAILMKPLNDRNVQLETHSEYVSNTEMSSRRADRNKTTKKNEPEATRETDESVKDAIEVDLVLAPVSGIPVYDIVKGDKIMIKINDKFPKGKYYIDLIGARVEGSIIPVPAEVMDIKKNDQNEYSILCKIKENIYGRAVETEQVKLKKYDELLDGERSLREFDLHEKSDGKRGFPFFVIVIGALTFVTLLVFLIMWFYNVL
jgi:hypothetical protein